MFWKGGHVGSPYNNGFLDMFIIYNGTEELEWGTDLIIGNNEYTDTYLEANVSNSYYSNTLYSGGDTFSNVKLKGIFIALNDNGDSWVSIDEVFVSTSSSVTQMVVNTDTQPWFCYFGASLPNPEITTDTANTGVYSCLFSKGGSGYYNTLLQNIENLDSDLVYSITLYALDASGSGGGQIQFKIKYSDSTYSYLSYTLTSSWALYTFTSMVESNKTIVQVLIKPIDFAGSYIYIDDISILSTEQEHTTEFILTMNPEPIWINPQTIGFESMSFGQYTGISSVANITIYYDDVATGNGTYIVTSSKTSGSGSIVNGLIQFMISARSYLTNNTKETFSVAITSTIYNGTIYFDAYWYNYSEDIITEDNTLSTIVSLIIPIGVYGSMIFLGLFITHWRFIGLLVGINVGTLIYFFVPNCPIWILPITILIDVVLVVFRPRGE